MSSQATLPNEALQAKDKMFRFALRFLGHPQDAEDVVQDVWIKLWERRTESPLLQVEAWCMHAVKNRCLDLLRHREVRQKVRRQLSSELSETDPDPADRRLHQLELRRCLDAAMNRLPLKQCMVVQLRDIEEYTYQDIAGILGIRLEDVKVSLFRARKTLRTLLTQSRAYEIR